MFSRSLVAFLFLTTGFGLHADVNIRTNIPGLHGVQAQAGAVSFNVDNDDFFSATPTDPVYIRLRLDHGVVLCQTLVAPGDNHDPIYLPAILNSGQAGDALTMEPGAIRIVRWNAGESAVWIAVTQSSSTWLESQSGNGNPTPVNPVSFKIGLSARVYDQIAVSSEEGGEVNANLPYPRYASSDRPVSTLFCVENSGNLEPLPQPASLSMLSFDPIAFQFSSGVETSPTEGGISTGPQLQVNFSNSTAVGRQHATRHTCALTATLQEPNPSLNATGFPDSYALSGGMRADCPVYPGARLALTLTDDDFTFFRLQVDNQNNPIPGGVGFLLEESVFELGPNWSTPSIFTKNVVELSGVWVAKLAIADYVGDGIAAPVDIRFGTTMVSLVADPDTPTYHISLESPLNAGILDTAPYDGADQAQACSRGITTGETDILVDGQQILITEVIYNAADNRDRVELYNGGWNTVDLSGWYLFNGFQYGQIGAGNQLQPGTRVVLYTNTSGDDTNTDWYLDRTVELENTGEAALAVNAQLDQTQFMRAYVQWGAGNQPSAAGAVGATLWSNADDYLEQVPAGQSAGLVQTAWAPFSSCDWAQMAEPSPGEPNTIDLQALYREQISGWPESTVLNLIRTLCKLEQLPTTQTASTASTHR